MYSLYELFKHPVRNTGETPIMKAALILFGVVALILGGLYSFSQMQKPEAEAVVPDTVIEAKAAPKVEVAEEAPEAEGDDNSVVYTEAATRDFTLVKTEVEYACKDPDRMACTETCKAMLRERPDTMKRVAVPFKACIGVPGINHRPQAPGSVEEPSPGLKAALGEDAPVVK